VPAASPQIDLAAVRRRIRLVAAALALRPTEIEDVMVGLATGDEAKLLAFAEMYGQSLDWIVTGDMAPMLRTLARQARGQVPLKAARLGSPMFGASHSPKPSPGE
jgi:hypothetical protein